MQRRTSAMCWLIISTGLVLACALPAKAAETTLQGTWIATKAEQDGKAADDLVGHRLSFMGNRFEIRSKDDKSLYAGTVQINPSTKPATIDFQQKKGALNGKVWKGIYAVDGDTLTTCDNAPNLKKGRPAAFEAKSGSGYVLITFKRAKHRDGKKGAKLPGAMLGGGEGPHYMGREHRKFCKRLWRGKEKPFARQRPRRPGIHPVSDWAPRTCRARHHKPLNLPV